MKLKLPKINRQPVMELQYSRNADSCSTNREQLFNKQGIGKFIFAIRWRSVETEKVETPFFQQ